MALVLAPLASSSSPLPDTEEARAREIERVFNAADVDGRGYLDRGQWPGMSLCGRRDHRVWLARDFTCSPWVWSPCAASIRMLIQQLRRGHEIEDVSEEEVSALFPWVHGPLPLD
jgi:hypothetical protein